MKKHEGLVFDIISKICQGMIFTERLLPERESAEKYHISRFLVKKALAKLKAG